NGDAACFSRRSSHTPATFEARISKWQSGQPSLTANVYTDPKLLDVHGALDALPSLPLSSEQSDNQERLRATGTDTYDRFSSCTEPLQTGRTRSATLFKRAQQLWTQSSP